MKLAAFAFVFVLAGCNVCNRDPKFWVPGEIVVIFKDGVTSETATAIVTRLGWKVESFDQGLSVVVVPHGSECDAEDALEKEPEVASALQNLYVFGR